MQIIDVTDLIATTISFISDNGKIKCAYKNIVKVKNLNVH